MALKIKFDIVQVLKLIDDKYVANLNKIVTAWLRVHFRETFFGRMTFGRKPWHQKFEQHAFDALEDSGQKIFFQKTNLCPTS
jgi:hypothetical protein